MNMGLKGCGILFISYYIGVSPSGKAQDLSESFKWVKYTNWYKLYIDSPVGRTLARTQEI